MMEPGSAAQIIGNYLDHLLQASGFDLEYTLGIQDPAHDRQPQSPESASNLAIPRLVEPSISIHFTGGDVPLLTERDAELLHAIETVAASILRLDRTEHHRLIVDAGNLRAERARSLEQAASDAVAEVHRTGLPFTFAPMNSRDRRQLHLAVAPTGLQTASTGEGPRRSVVLYPPGQTPPPPVPYTARPRRDSPPSRLSVAGSEPSAVPPRGRPAPLDPRWIASASDPDVQPHNAAALASEGSSEQSKEDRIRAIRERFRKR